MAGWPHVVLTLGVALISVGAALGAVALQNWLAGRRALVEKGAAALAPVTTLLTNVEPDRLAVNAGEESLRELGELRARWEATVRVPLAAFALSHPERRVRDLATELDVHVEWVLIRGVSLARDVLSHRDFRPVQEMVWSHYRDAQRLIDELHEALHGGNKGATRPPETGRDRVAHDAGRKPVVEPVSLVSPRSLSCAE